MNRALLVVLLVAASVALGPGVGQAQQIPSPYRYIENSQEAGAFVGTLDPETGILDLGPRAGTVAGLRYAIEITGPFSIEAVGRTLFSERDVRDPRREQGDRTIGEADVLLTSLEGRLKFSLTGRRTWHGLSPYVTAGGGVVWDMAGRADIEENLRPEDRFDVGASFLGTLGLGGRWIPTDHIQLRAGGGLNLWQIDTPDGYRDPQRDLGLETPPPESEWVSGLEATVGAAIRW